MSSAPLRASLLDFRRAHHVPAAGAALVDRDGHVVVDVVGVCERGGVDPATADDAWHIGSCGKSMTAALYARLVACGAARWGAPLAELLADVSIHPDWNGITIDDALVHRSGLPANLRRSELMAGLRDPRPLRDQRTDAVAGALARAPVRQGRFRYSNLGYIVAGAAIERICGLPFEEALTVHVLQPLGMSTAGFGAPDRILGHGGRLSMVGTVGLVVGRGRPANPADAASDNPAVMCPAGRLHVTLRDWARFQHVFLARDSAFLTADSVDRLCTPTVGGPPNQAMGWAPAELAGVSVGQQGSNTFWMAAALIDDVRARTAMVVCNDGRTRLLAATARFAAGLLAAGITVSGDSTL